MDNRTIEHSCAFTGHRPERLAIPEADVILWLNEQVRHAVNDGYKDFITGCSAVWMYGRRKRF